MRHRELPRSRKTTLSKLWVGIFYGGAKESNTPTTEPSSFFVLRWTWPDQPTQSAYYVPGNDALRVIGNPASRTGYADFRPRWLRLDDSTNATMERLVASLQPFAAPAITRVTVGGHAARDPASYRRIWTVGAPAPLAYSGGWLRVRLTSAAPSPWGDSGPQVFVARKGGWLARDGTFFRVSRAFAARFRARKSLNF